MKKRPGNTKLIIHSLNVAMIPKTIVKSSMNIDVLTTATINPIHIVK